MNKNKRYEELDCLRGLAALAVVLFHFTYGYDFGLKIMSEDKFYFRYGNLGVQLFFLISGFVIFMTLDKTKKAKDFLVSRFSRLYPAYWASIIITVTITTLLEVPFQEGIFSVKQVIVNFTMFQYWFKIKDVDGAYWTLAIELIFYIIMLLIFLFKKLNYIIWICLIWLVLSVCFAAFEIPLGNYIKAILILRFAPLFVGGIAFYLLKNKPMDIFLHILILLSLCTEYYLLYQLDSDCIVYWIIFFFYVLFYLFIYDKLGFISNKFLVFLGSISYSLYLIHENIGIGIIYWLKKIADIQLFYLPITIILVIFLASFITFYIERPALKWIRKYYVNFSDNNIK
ncbi:MAG: acyltransferase [Flavobacterium sp.]|uniref:acyltransferase family protein n=1 Tax=Flavobacterium sp. TaxID=239 RepID=UPI002735714B|nr:acyltransferase [Flavobacterium sp.]MDP3679575.1 acyltransferase [Flavobacterium sp.]